MVFNNLSSALRDHVVRCLVGWFRALQSRIRTRSVAATVRRNQLHRADIESTEWDRPIHAVVLHDRARRICFDIVRKSWRDFPKTVRAPCGNKVRCGGCELATERPAATQHHVYTIARTEAVTCESR